MAKTREYMDYLDEQIEISPAGSEEEYQAAQTIERVMHDHGLETQLQEFDAYPWGRLMPPVLGVIAFACLIACGLTQGIAHIITLLVALLCVAGILTVHFGRNIFENFGPAANSQNVVGIHRAEGPQVQKGARPIVIVAHYDTPRTSPLYRSPLSRFQAVLKRLTAPCTIVVAVSLAFQLLAFLPNIVRIFTWVVGILASLPILFMAVMTFVDTYGSCSVGANDNKSSVAALLGVLDTVRPSEDSAGDSKADGTASRPRAAERAQREVAQPVTRTIEVREEVKGIRHGKSVLASLGILSPACEVVYEEPKVRMVEEQVPVDVWDEEPGLDPLEKNAGEIDDTADSEYVAEPADDLAPIDYEDDEVGYTLAEDDYEEDEDYLEGSYDSPDASYEDETYEYDEEESDLDTDFDDSEDDVDWEDEDLEYDEDDEEDFDYDEEDFDEDADYEEDDPDSASPTAVSRIFGGIRGWFGARAASLRAKADADEDDDEDDLYEYDEDDEYEDGYDDWEDADEEPEEYEADFDDDAEDEEAFEEGFADENDAIPDLDDDLEDIELNELEPEAADEELDEWSQEFDDEEDVYDAEYEEIEPSEEEYEDEYALDETQSGDFEESSLDDFDSENLDFDEDDFFFEEEILEYVPKTPSAPDDSVVVVSEVEEAEDSEYEEPSEKVVDEEEAWYEEDLDDDLDDELEADWEEVDSLTDEDGDLGWEEEAEEESYFEGEADDEGDLYEEESYYYGAELDEEDQEDYEYDGLEAPAGKTGGILARIKGFFSKKYKDDAEAIDVYQGLGEDLVPNADEWEEAEADLYAAEPYEGTSDDEYSYYAEDEYELAEYEEDYTLGENEDDGPDDPQPSPYVEAEYDEEAAYDAEPVEADEWEEVWVEDATQEDETYADVVEPVESYEPLYQQQEAEPQIDEYEYLDAEYEYEADEPDYVEEADYEGETELFEAVPELLADPNTLHFDREEDDDIVPRDTAGLDEIADSYDMYASGEIDRVVSYELPTPVDDPEWGISTYRPARPSLNIARRAALYDVPDPSGQAIDPLAEPKDDDSGYYEGSYYDADYDTGAYGEQDTEPPVDDDGRGDVPRRSSFWGGATVREDERSEEGEPLIIDAEDLQDAILQMGDEFLVAHDIWFVATGASNVDHAGIKAFLDEHRRDIRGAFLVNLESVGAGELTVVNREGLRAPRRADRRLVRMLTSIAEDLHIPLATKAVDWDETESASAMRQRVRAVTVAGLDENGLPAYSHTDDDVPDTVDPRQVSSVVRLVCELIRRS